MPTSVGRVNSNVPTVPCTLHLTTELSVVVVMAVVKRTKQNPSCTGNKNTWCTVHACHSMCVYLFMTAREARRAIQRLLYCVHCRAVYCTKYFVFCKLITFIQFHVPESYWPPITPSQKSRKKGTPPSHLLLCVRRSRITHDFVVQSSLTAR